MHLRVHPSTMSEKGHTKLTFNKSERLKSRSTINSLFVLNQNIRIYPFKIVWVTNSAEKFHVEAGVSVSKRLFKSAVKRNLIKRRLREAYRQNKMLIFNRFSDRDIKISFMLIYLGKEIDPYKEFDLKIKQLLVRLGDSIEKKKK